MERTKNELEFLRGIACWSWRKSHTTAMMLQPHISHHQQVNEAFILTVFQLH